MDPNDDLVVMLREDAEDLESRSNGELPYMVDNMRQAAAELESLKQDNSACCATNKNLQRKVRKLRIDVARLRETLENISTVEPRERFPAVTALGYCRQRALEALAETDPVEPVTADSASEESK